jgi:hypothetical protein
MPVQAFVNVCKKAKKALFRKSEDKEDGDLVAEAFLRKGGYTRERLNDP